MTSEEAPAQRRTWAEWLSGPPDRHLSLMTRKQFLDRLNEDNLRVTRSTLAYWESEGILPAGIPGRKDNSPQTFYPSIAIEAVRRIRNLQARGDSLSQIKDAIQSLQIEHWADQMLTPYTEEERRQHSSEMFRQILDRRLADIGPLVREIAELHQIVTRVEASSASITLSLADGQTAQYPIDLAPPSSSD